MRYFGHDAVAVLDNGLAGWPGPLETGGHSVPRGDFVAGEPRTSAKVDYGDVRELSGDLVLLDARRPARYRGEFEPTDPKAGHIPGAFGAPWGENLDSAGRFKPPDELRRRFRDLGVEDGGNVVAYCGSGVSACVTCSLVRSRDSLEQDCIRVLGVTGPRDPTRQWQQATRRIAVP